MPDRRPPRSARPAGWLAAVCLLWLAAAPPPAAAGTVITGLRVSVDTGDAVTVHNQGSSAAAGAVGFCPTAADCGYPYTNGWLHDSGSIQWSDPGGVLTLELDATAMHIRNQGGSADGARTGSVQLAGSTTLGAHLRAITGGVNGDFTSAVSRNTLSSIDFDVTGCVMFTAPDLIVEAPSTDDPAVTPGQGFTLSATVRNQGGRACDVSTLTWYRSDDNAVISTFDTEIGTDAVGLLLAGETSPESLATSIPSEGTYWLGACIDPIHGESLPNNQCSTGVKVVVGQSCGAVTVADLTVASMTTFQACGELTGGPALEVTTPLGAAFYGGETVRFVDGFSVAAGAEMTAGVCGQNLCAAGAETLAASCHPCVQSVCAVDPVCCTDPWDAECVELVQSACELVCP